MVNILRDQMRQYTPDQSAAIRESQLAQNVSEWNSVIQNVGKIAQSYAADQAKADETMINTQIGSTGETELMEWNQKQIAKGVDPTTDQYKQRLYAERDRIYQPLIDQMESSKGREFMQKQSLEVGEKIRRANIGKIGQNRKRAQAANAFRAATNQMRVDAQEFGKLGDWDGFREATDSSRKAMLKYAKAQGGEAGEAAAAVQMDLSDLVNYLGGQAQTDPYTVLTILDDKETLRKVVYKELEKQDPKMTAAEKEKRFEEMYKRSGQKASADEQLDALMTDSVRKSFTDNYQKSKMAEKRALQERLNSLPKGSRAYDSVKKQIEEIQGQIDDSDSGARELLRSALNASPIRDMARKQIELNDLQEKQANEENFISTHIAAISPDQMMRFEARSSLALNPMSQKVIDGFWNSDKVSPMSFQKAFDDYLEEDRKILDNTQVTYRGTDALAKAVNKALEGGEKPDVERMADTLNALTELHKTPGLTQEEFEHVENILHTAMLDNVFGEMTSKVLQSPDRYFADTSWLTNIVNPTKVNSNLAKDTLGLPANTRDASLGAVNSYLQSNAIKITDTAVAMLSQAATLPTTEMRQAAVQDVENYIAKEKQSCYDYAMKTFGIDLAKLREEKKKNGRAFTQIGWRIKEYMGDDPDGKPLFQPATDQQMYNTVVKRINEGLETSKSASRGAEKAEKAVQAYNKAKNRL